MISITFLVACFNLFLALIMLFKNWKLNKNVIFFSMFLMIMSFNSVLYDTIINGGSAHLLMLLIGNSGPLLFLAGPLFYFFIKGLVEEKNSFSNKDLLHIVPFFMSMIVLIPYLFKPVEYKLELARNSLQNLPYYMNSVLVYFPIWFTNTFGILSVTFYIILSMRILKRICDKKVINLTGAIKKQYVINLRWLKSIAFASLFLIVLLAGITLYFRFDPEIIYPIDNNSLFFVSVFFNSFFPILILLNPGILFGLPTNEVLNPIIQTKNDLKGESRYSVLEAADEVKTHMGYFKGLSQEITDFIINEKPYLNSDFESANLRDKLEAPSHHIQFCLKYHIGSSFTELMNQYRVAHAIYLMNNSTTKKQNDYLQKVSDESGFNKLAAFKKAFKKIEKKSLTQWLAENT